MTSDSATSRKDDYAGGHASCPVHSLQVLDSSGPGRTALDPRSYGPATAQLRSSTCVRRLAARATNAAASLSHPSIPTMERRPAMNGTTRRNIAARNRLTGTLNRISDLATGTCADCGKPVRRVSETCDIPECRGIPHWYHDQLADMVSCPGTAPHVRAVEDNHGGAA